MKIEQILISDENTSFSNVAVATVEDDRKVQETVDFKMVTFSLSGKDYALDIMYVKEIAKAGQFTYVPNTMPFVVGVYNLRGEIIPILDMRIFFNIDSANTNHSGLQNLLILTVEDQTFGIIVDKIDKVVGIQKSTIQPPHPLFVDINIKYISGVVESNKRLYILLDIARIFSKTKDEEEIKAERRLQENQMQLRVAQANNARKVEEKSSNVTQTTESAKEEKTAGAVEQKPSVPDFDETNYKFVVEGLKQFAGFTVSSINESWVQHRFSEWAKERDGKNVQIQNAGDASIFLKPFWSSYSEKWWSNDFADKLYSLLPENAAKQIVVWNPGCGKGMESYCLACVLAKRYPNAKIRVYAQDTDLLAVSNAPMLTVPDSAETAWLEPYLTKTASGAKAFNQQIKESIMFEYHDCRHTNSLPMADIVFARDLLSLLDLETQKSVANDFVEKLKGNGSLFVGENETVHDISDFIEHTEGALTAFSKQ